MSWDIFTQNIKTMLHGELTEAELQQADEDYTYLSRDGYLESNEASEFVQAMNTAGYTNHWNGDGTWTWQPK